MKSPDKPVLDVGTVLYFPEDIDPDSSLVLKIEEKTSFGFDTCLYIRNGERCRQEFTKKALEHLVHNLHLRYKHYQIKKGDL